MFLFSEVGMVGVTVIDLYVKGYDESVILFSLLI